MSGILVWSCNVFKGFLSLISLVQGWISTSRISILPSLLSSYAWKRTMDIIICYCCHHYDILVCRKRQDEHYQIITLHTNTNKYSLFPQKYLHFTSRKHSFSSRKASTETSPAWRIFKSFSHLRSTVSRITHIWMNSATFELRNTAQDETWEIQLASY